MSDILIQLIFGWPAIILSLLISVGGIALRKPWFLVVGGVVAIPFSWYLSGFPAIRSPAILLPLFQFGSAAALWYEKRLLAWLLLLPLALIIVFLAIVVFSQ